MYTHKTKTNYPILNNPLDNGSLAWENRGRLLSAFTVHFSRFCSFFSFHFFFNPSQLFSPDSHSHHQLREVLPSEHSNFKPFLSFPSSPMLTHFLLTCDPASLNHERINRSSIFQLKIRGEIFSNRRMMMLVVVVFFRWWWWCWLFHFTFFF